MKGKDVAISHQNLERRFLKKQEAFYAAKQEMDAAKVELTEFRLQYGHAVKAMQEAQSSPSLLSKLLGN